MEMEKQQYAKPALIELAMPKSIACGWSPIEPIKPLRPDDDGEETPDDVDVE